MTSNIVADSIPDSYSSRCVTNLESTILGSELLPGSFVYFTAKRCAAVAWLVIHIYGACTCDMHIIVQQHTS